MSRLESRIASLEKRMARPVAAPEWLSLDGLPGRVTEGAVEALRACGAVPEGWMLPEAIPWSRYIPVLPTARQLAFLLLPCREALLGGACGGGKSIALLMAALQYAGHPGYSALLLRRTYSDLSLPGALMDVARQWLGRTAARWADTEKTWTFPSGATLTFGYLADASDKYRYQSTQFSFLGWDELTQFQEVDYRYMFSRLRRVEGSAIPLRMRAASNPGGIGAEWVKQRFMVEPGPERVFLPAKLADNPHLDQAEYIQSLNELDPITREQLLNGDWSARAEGGMFKREWFPVVDSAPADCRRIRFWDLAATAAKPGKDPDWTVGALMGRARDNTLYVIHLARLRGTPGEVEALVRQTAEVDGKATMVRMEQEPGASGVRVIDDFTRRVLMGYDFRGIRSTGDKITRARPLASQAQAGNVKLVRGPWITAFLDECELFPKGSHDDQVDAASGALSSLATASTGIPMALCI